jgi:hypothetical protein
MIAMPLGRCYTDVFCVTRKRWHIETRKPQEVDPHKHRDLARFGAWLKTGTRGQKAAAYPFLETLRPRIS